MLLLVEIYALKVTIVESSLQERPLAAHQLFYPTKEQVFSQSASSARLVPTVLPPLKLMIQISALRATFLRLAFLFHSHSLLTRLLLPLGYA